MIYRMKRNGAGLASICILLMFAFDNTALNIAINLICFAAFGLLYALVYRITSGAYYSIVSKNPTERA